MKKNFTLICFLSLSCFVSAQYDTSFTLTPTATNAAAWLRNLNPASGTGRIGILQGEMGPLALGSNARNYVDTTSVYDLYNNSTFFNAALSSAKTALRNYFILAKRMGANVMRCPESFSWALIEPVPGVYNYSLTDTIVKIANHCDVNVLATICPYADSSMECNTTVGSGCSGLFDANFPMYFINNGRTGPICDEDSARYKTFIQNIVERYDGDGVNDMPGLLHPITYYEFNNEPNAPCGNHMTYSEYGHDMRMTYEAMKSACSTCQLLHGGSGSYLDSTFYIDLYDEYHDYFEGANYHVNEPRDGVFNLNYLSTQLQIAESKGALYGKDYDVWLTEFGIYMNSPHGETTTPTITEEDQAARYAKFYTYGLAHNIAVTFYDQQGDTASGIGSSALMFRYGMTREAKLCLYTLWLMDYKFSSIDSASVKVFSADTSFSFGHVRIHKSGYQYDVVWGLNSLPPDITGVKQCTDIYGNISIQDVSTLSFPLSSNPLIIEDYITGINSITNEKLVVDIFPNPANDMLHVNIRNIDFTKSKITLEIHDVIGQIKYRQELKTLDTPVDIIRWQSGFYLYDVLQNGVKVSTGKFIKE